MFAIIDFKTKMILASSESLKDLQDIYQKILPTVKTEIYSGVKIVEMQEIK